MSEKKKLKEATCCAERAMQEADAERARPFARLVHDEAGMTMGLAVIMIVLIGVMGAGLLTFVQRDLEAVVEVNRGQKALDLADAGVETAIAHLRQDSVRQHYDRDRSNDCTNGRRVRNEDWSPSTGYYTDAINCTGDAVRNTDQVGVSRNFADGNFRVTIECFDQVDDPGIDPCKSNATGTAPEANTSADVAKFFRVVSTGYSSTSGDGAVRRVEAIIKAKKLDNVPSAYFTPRSIEFNGNPTLSKVGFFAAENIGGVNQGSISVDRNADSLYGDWYAPPYNTVGRRSASGGVIDGVGFGAVGLVCSKNLNQCSSDSDSYADGRNDFDRTTATKGMNKKFVFKTDGAGQPAPERTLGIGEISFPFDPGNINDPSTVVDPDLINELEEVARGQGTYCDSSACATINSWPGYGTVYFVDGLDATFKVKQTPLATGMIVVRNGNFTLNNASDGFGGIVIAIGDGTTTGNFTTMGSTNLDGYAIASGTMNIGGNVSPQANFDYSSLFVLSNVSVWSWRERYDQNAP